jgi:RimJ/RimL family protein N-acetyltransferase
LRSPTRPEDRLWDIGPDHDHAMISYWVGPGARGRGRAPAAVSLLAGWAFAELELTRLALLIEPDNVASRRVAERCGFAHEDTLHGHFTGRAHTRVDALVYELRPDEPAQT